MWKKSARVSPDEFDNEHGSSSHDEYDTEKGQHKMSELGPVKKRKCRDVIFLILFLLYWVGMFIVASSAAQNGDLTRLTYVR